MFKVLVCPFWVLAKMFHPSVGDAVTKDEATFNHFKAEFASAIDTVPCPAVFSECTEIATKGQNTVKEENTALDEMCNASKNIPGSKRFSEEKKGLIFL